MADANHQQSHEGLSRKPPCKGGNAKSVKNTQSKDCAICLSFGHANRAKSHSSEKRWWNKTNAEGMAQEASKDPPKVPVRKVDENHQSTPSGKGQQSSGGKGNQGPSSQGCSPENFKERNGKSTSAKGNGEKGNFSKGKGQSNGQFSKHSKGVSAGEGKGTSEGTKGRRGKRIIRSAEPSFRSWYISASSCWFRRGLL